jgi:hypothetical protein
MRMFTKSSERRSRENKAPMTETIVWIRRHAPLADLCLFGGWPDDSQLRVEVCNCEPHQWIVNITFVETIMEISECDVTERERCGQYAVSFDEAGHPVDIRLVQPL